MVPVIELRRFRDDPLSSTSERLCTQCGIRFRVPTNSEQEICVACTPHMVIDKDDLLILPQSIDLLIGSVWNGSRRTRRRIKQE